MAPFLPNGLMMWNFLVHILIFQLKSLKLSLIEECLSRSFLRDGTSIGWVVHYISSQNFGWIEIGYCLVPKERGKGYGTEAIRIIVDYLFLTRDIPRVQAVTSVENEASQRVLEKSGFKREGTIRKALWTGKGKWTDGLLYSILKEEWKEPKILAKSNVR